MTSICRHRGEGIMASKPPVVSTPVERVTREIVTYNVNSITAAIGREDGKLLKFVESRKADVIALQEIMIDPEKSLKGAKWRITPFIRRVRALGYHVYVHPGSRNGGGYGGTMFFTLLEPEQVVLGTGQAEIDEEGWFLALVFSDV